MGLARYLAAALFLQGAAFALRPEPHVELRPNHPAAAGDRHEEVTAIPGYPQQDFPSRHFSGYVEVDRDHGRRLFYYFVTAQTRRPLDSPVVLWLNGGPGCSSFDGFVYEHGPFKFSFQGNGPDRRLVLDDNPHTWSREANVLYVDSPAGVGMSYSETKSDYTTNDSKTAADLDTFLRRWFGHHKDFLAADFYIAGESYAGVYVPMAAQAVLDGNDAGREPRLALRGYLVGNGVTDAEHDGDALLPFAYGQSLIGRRQYEETRAACGGSYWNATRGSACDRALDAVWDTLAGVNLYDVLQPCWRGSNPYQGAAGAAAAEPGALRDALRSHRGWPLPGGVRVGPVPGLVDLRLGHTPPCLDSREMWAFLNDPAVREAIHAEPIERIGRFDECTNGQRIQYSHDAGSMLPVHLDLLKRGMAALIYSGDHDMAVPHTGTEAWTSSVGLEERQAWGAWLTDEGQVAGYTVRYREGLVYATIKGASHMVPETHPAEALTMFRRFLSHGHLRVPPDA